MGNPFKRAIIWVRRHKIIAVVLILLAAGGSFLWYRSAHQAAGKVSYVTQPAVKGTVVAYVSGSGQVSASDQIDLKAKVSENVTGVYVANGQQVAAGQLLMQLDTADAQKAIRDAQSNLDNAQLSLQKLTQTGSFSITQSQQQAQDNLTKDYTDGFNAVSNTFLDLPGIMSGLDSVLFGYDLSRNSQNLDYYRDYTKPYDPSAQKYADDAYNSYQTALTAYNANFADYKALSRSADPSSIGNMINETYTTTQDIADAVKSASDLIQFYKDVFTAQQIQTNPVADTQLASLNTYTGKVNTDLSGLLGVQSSIKNDQDSIAAAKVNLQSQDFSVQQQQLAVQQAQNSLQDAKDNLANCSIYAPFGGVVAAIDYKKGDAATSGGTALTLITNQSITEIPFNEVDVTKIKVGQKATLTFDAIDGLSIVGQVADIDTLGTVTQGVVNYNVKIVFDSQNSQVKPGMSVNANIITATAQDVLEVPSAAVHQDVSGQNYVEVLVNGAPQQKTVQTGISDDTNTQIVSGINEGDTVVTQTVTQGAATTTPSSSSGGLRLPGLTGGGGGTFIRPGGRSGAGG